MNYTEASILVYLITFLMTMATMFDPTLNTYTSRKAWAIAISSALMTAWGVSSL